MHKNTKWLLSGAVIYFVIFLLEQFSPLPEFISWWTAVGIISILIFSYIFTKIQAVTLTKVVYAVLSVFIGFIISFVYTNIALWHAEKLCRPLVEAKYEIEV